MWFNPSEITKNKSAPVATPATLATFQSKNNAECSKVAEVAKVATRQHSEITTVIPIKPLSIQDRQSAARRQKVLDMLESAPYSPRAVCVDTDSDPNFAILAVAIRHLATFEMAIPKATYNPWQLLEMIERMSTDDTHGDIAP
jgi:hypothetical protein